MLSSLTPLGERGRHAHWTITVTAFLIGALAVAGMLGAALGAAGQLLVSGVSESPRLALVGVGLVLGAVVDLGPRPVPGPRRQVDERWLDRYRGWVYGVGYGAQLGAGLATVVTSAATYVALMAAFLTADPGRGALVVGVYGVIRGLTPLATATVTTPDRLLAFHMRLQRARRGVALLATVLLALAAVPAMAIAAGL
jgi:cytochrome c biogenesis protein CcdA